MIDLEKIKNDYNLFAQIQADTQLKPKGRNWWEGACPFCGGEDRFVVKLENGEYQWFCRVCGDGKYHDAIDYVIRRENVNFKNAVDLMGGGPLVDPIVVEERRAQYAAERLKRQQEIDTKIAKFSTDEIWLALHRRLDETRRQWWRDQGIPDNWQDALSLGYMDDKKYRSSGGELRTSPAYTIPYFNFDNGKPSFKTMQYRLTDPENPADRYRFEYGLDTTYYDTTPENPMDDICIICEGAKKAIVTKIFAGNGITCLAIPSKTDFGGVTSAITDNIKRVYVVLDPDGYDKPPAASVDWIPPQRKLAYQIGARARVVDLPMKVDDAITSGMPKDLFINYLKQGTKVSNN